MRSFLERPAQGTVLAYQFPRGGGRKEFGKFIGTNVLLGRLIGND